MTEKRRRLRDASVPLRRIIPNMLTTGALCSGIASLHFTGKEDFARACGAVGMAMVLDGLDGRAARLLKATSRFGETFDSLADFVSFGIAPAFLLYRWCRPDMVLAGYSLEGPLLIAVVMFALCSAMRLARFTAMQRRKKPGAEASPFFTGLPTPAAAGAAMIPPMLLQSDAGLRTPTWVVILLAVTIAMLMISRLPFFSFKRLRMSRSWAVPLMVTMGLVVAAAARDAWLTSSVVAAVYAFSLPLSMRKARIEAAKEASEAVAAPSAV